MSCLRLAPYGCAPCSDRSRPAAADVRRTGLTAQNSARLAVKPCRKSAAADRTDLARAERARDRERAERAGRRRRRRGRARRRSGAAAVAGEEERGRRRPRRRAARRRSSSAAAGVADVELHRLADRRRRRRRRSRRSRGSPPSTLRTRKSPRPKSAWCSSTTRPRCRPARMSARSSSLASVAVSCTRSMPGSPRELVDPVALAAGDDVRRADRAAPLRHDGPHGEAVDEARRPRPWSATRPSSTSRLPPGPRAADAAPPITWSSGRSSRRRARKPSTGKLNGSARSSSVDGSPSRSGQPVIGGAVGRALQVERDRRERGVGTRDREHRDRGRVLDLARAADDADHRRAEQHARFEQVGEREGEVVDGADEVR